VTDYPLVPSDLDTTFYLVMNDFGDLGCAYVETEPAKADLETIIADLISGQYSSPARVTAVNVAEGWARDVSEDIAREIWHRKLAGRTLARPVIKFLERHTAFPIPVE